MSKLPKSAKLVIIGQGGIVGASVAHHLVKLGWDNIVGLDKSSIPTSIGSTSHASDFCFTTDHNKLSVYTTTYSQNFYEQRGNYVRIGGIEVARVGDDERMEELKRKVGSGKAFGTNVSIITPKQTKELFPLIDETLIQGAMWDPDAGLVVPRSQKVAGDLVDECVKSGKLQAFANTTVTGIDVQNGLVCGVETDKGYIRTSMVVLSTGIWGPILAKTAGVRLPLMPIEHPLMYFGPYDALAGTNQEIGYPLLRDQGNSAYFRDTGSPETTEGGSIEWGYYEETKPRLVFPEDIKEAHDARLSPSMNDLELEQVLEPFEKAIPLTPILGELGWEEKASFNGLLSVTADGSSILGESPQVQGLWFGEAVWIKDGPGVGKIMADWMTHGRLDIDPHHVDVARFYPIQTTPKYVYDRCYENAQKIYTPPVHPREPYQTGRNMRRSPFWPREVELGGYFMEAGGWERAHGYQANEERLKDYLNDVPERDNEWDARHFWRVSNAEQLAMSEHVGMINLSHFAIFDITGPDAGNFLEYLSVAKVAGNTPLGKGVYTHFLNPEGGIHSDITIVRMDDNHFRLVSGGDTGPRDYAWLLRAQRKGKQDITIMDKSEEIATLGVWGPKARETLASFLDDPEELSHERFPFATAKQVWIQGIPAWMFRISYVGEQGFEIYFPFAYGLKLWDLLYDASVIPVGIETYANSRRLEKSLRLQNTDLEIEYNLYEAGLSRPKVKEADFIGKTAYLEQRERAHQPAYLCTMTMEDNVDSNGVPRYPVGHWPILEETSREVITDTLGRRSYTTSIAYGPSLKKNIVLGYIAHDQAIEGNTVYMEYFGEHYPLKIEVVGYKALYDPENIRVKS